MTAIDRQQDHQARHAAMPPGCDHCGRCIDDEQDDERDAYDEGPCTRRLPVLLMPPSMIESLRAVEMKTLALSQDDVQLMDDAHQLDLNF